MHFLLAVLLVGAVAIVFGPALQNGFVSWDDQWYVLGNQHLTVTAPEDIVWFFTHSYYWSYIPLTLLSHALDYALWGQTPLGHHLTSLVLHTVNTLWVFVLALSILRMAGDGAGFEEGGARAFAAFAAALLFSLHPLRAESVAWISDRKDLLCAFFLLPALIAYLRARTSSTAPVQRRWLAVSLGFYLCGLLSKAAALMFPVVLVLLERLFLGAGKKGEDLRASVGRVVPFAVASLVVGVVGLASTPARTLNFLTVDLTSVQKMLLPFHTIVSPLGTLLWPHSLGPIYDYPEGLLVMVLSLVIVLLVTAAAAVLARMRLPGVQLAWSVYLVMSVPTALFFLTGIQPLADRYSYLSMMSIMLLAGVGLAQLLRGLDAFPGRVVVMAAVAGLAVVLGVRTQSQVIVWRSSLSLWSHAVRVAPSSPVTFCNLGQAHLEAGALQEASLALSVAARLKPDYADVYNNMGVVSILKGDVRGGRRLLERARSLLEEERAPGPELADVYRNLGEVHYELGDLDSALASYRRCLTAQPQDALAWYGMSHVLDGMGHREEALRARERAARLGNHDAQREVEDALRSVEGGGRKSENPP
jgi:hypothetical protein